MEGKSIDVRLRVPAPLVLTLVAVAGGATGLVLSMVSADAGDILGFGPTDDAEDVLTPVIAALAIGAAVAWRKRPLARAFTWSLAGVAVALTAFMSEVAWLVPVALALVYLLPLLPVPAALRLAGIVPMVLLFGLFADLSLADDWSGVAFLLLSLGYLVLWGLRERTPWARHTAWALAALWSVAAFVMTLADLFVYVDRVAVASAVLTAVLVGAIGTAWVLLGRRIPAPTAAAA